MDDLKNLVIQSLEEEGTLSHLRAQLRSRVFKAIEKHADQPKKDQVGFQWQNPIASKIHENEESKLVAQLVREYLEYYRMEYTLSVYLPEVCLQNQEALPREELCKKAGLKPPSSAEQSAPLLVHLLKNLKQGGGAASSDNVKQHLPDLKEEKPLKNQAQEKKVIEEEKQPQKKEEKPEIEEDIVEEIVDENHQNFGGKDEQEGVGASTSMGVDQSIDTLQMDQYDYVEDIK